MTGMQAVQTISQGSLPQVEGLLVDVDPEERLHNLSPLASIPASALKFNNAKELPVQGTVDAGDLQAAFELFNEMSEQLADSYAQLENKVSELTSELTQLTNQRMQELAGKRADR